MNADWLWKAPTKINRFLMVSFCEQQTTIRWKIHFECANYHVISNFFFSVFFCSFGQNHQVGIDLFSYWFCSFKKNFLSTRFFSFQWSRIVLKKIQRFMHGKLISSHNVENVVTAVYSFSVYRIPTCVCECLPMNVINQWHCVQKDEWQM